MKLIEKGPWSIDQSTRYKVFEYNQHVEQNQDGTKSYHDCLKVFDDCTLYETLKKEYSTYNYNQLVDTLKVFGQESLLE